MCSKARSERGSVADISGQVRGQLRIMRPKNRSKSANGAMFCGVGTCCAMTTSSKGPLSKYPLPAGKQFSLDADQTCAVLPAASVDVDQRHALAVRRSWLQDGGRR